MTGNELRQHRRILGLTQFELGERIGMTREMIGRMECGKKRVSPRTIAAIEAVAPKVVGQPLVNHSRLLRKLEESLQKAGVRYVPNHKFGDQRVDFYLIDLGIAVYADPERSEARRAVTTHVDTISIAGKFALDAFITLIDRGGFHAQLHAGRDPYAANP